MKLILFIMLLLSSQLLSAQPADTSRVSSEMKQAFLVKRLTEELSLTNEQQTAVRQIIRDRSLELVNAKSHTKGSLQRKELVQTTNGKAIQELKRVLTKEQFKLFVNLRRELKEQREAYYATKGQEYNPDDEELDF